MSLHKFADMVAKQGRGDDSLLIHMTPDEVQRLQAFAQANGRSLTINPETGLPEAGMLSDLFKAVAPIALGAFLGPAGMGLTIGGLSSAATAGLVTGGITSLATGSLSRGLMAGLGAYGGAGLGESLMNAGSASLATQAMTPELMEQAAGAGANYDQLLASEVGAKTAASTPFDTLKAGASAVTDSGSSAMQFAKQNLGNISAAAAPIMAGAMVPTTTKMPESTNPAYIRQKLYDPYTQTYKSLTPVKASEWGSRNFSDAYTNPQTGIASVLDVRKPEPMATGGIVALATGGVSDQQVVDWFKANPGADDKAIAAAMQQYDVSPEQIARATGTQGQQADYEKRFVQAISTPGTSAEEFQAATSDVGLQNQALANAMQGAGMSAAAQYASTHNLSDVGGITDPNNFYSQFGYKTGALPGDQGGLEGLYANINYSASGLQNLVNSGKMTAQQAREAALTEMMRSGTSAADLKAATGKSLAELFPDTTKKPVTPFVNPVTGGTINPPTRVTDTVLPTDPTVNAPPGTKNPYGGPNTPGDKTYNPDGSITVTPNIPGRPYGGFSGMDEVKNAYTAGGGSLGYIPKAPKTIAEFDAMYNQQTGDSLAAYNYLMGKGGAKFPIQSVAASTGINRPYWTGAMRYKPKFLTANKDGTVTTSETNPNAPSANVGSVAEAKTINVVNNRGETEIATLGPDGKYRTAGGETYDSSGAIVMAQGGISGDGNLNLHIPLDFGGGGGGGQSGIGDYGAGTPIPMMGTLGASNGSVNPNDSIGGYGSPYRPDERGGLYKGPMGIPAGLDDSGMGSPEILARAKANDAARASASTSPVSLDALAKALGGGMFANGGVTGYAMGGGLGSLGSYSDGGRLLKGPGDGVSDSIPATIGAKRQPARLADGEFVIPARIVSELGNGSTEAGARKLYAMMDRVQKARSKTTGKNKVAANTRADKHLPA